VRSVDSNAGEHIATDANIPSKIMENRLSESVFAMISFMVCAPKTTAHLQAGLAN